MVYSRSSFVDVLCVCADSLHDFPVGIIVLSKSRAETFLGKKFNSDSEYVAACSNPVLLKAVAASLHHCTEEAKMSPTKRMRAFRLVTDEWTPESGLVTSALKLKRSAIASRYAQKIQEMFDTPDM
eukprot:TRINITY_DN18_c0_g1_i5.p1 TRINITY_DN18_c0_g1~~TRINITY_DN18_c0_g1_i5.p1  ORF type:complete len:126 (-),score=17.80 TRINITY_DN18_c0_g1_i5:85-462(-)